MQRNNVRRNNSILESEKHLHGGAYYKNITIYICIFKNVFKSTVSINIQYKYKGVIMRL